MDGLLTVATAGLPKLIQAATFPVGLIMVILAGSELFTGKGFFPSVPRVSCFSQSTSGNCMFLILPLIEKKITVKDFCKNWCWSYIGNFIGSVAVGMPSIFVLCIVCRCSLLFDQPFSWDT